MKVVAINGSARKDGNTAILLRTVLKELENEGIQTEMIQLAGQDVHGCRACYQCRELANMKCVIDTDPVNEIISAMEQAHGILIGSPTYFTDVPAGLKALIDRAGFVARGNGHFLRRKVSAAVVAVRRAGSLHVFDTINHFFTISQMIVTGSTYWNLGIGGKIGEVESDREGLENMKNLGENMAWLLKKLYSEG